MRSDANPRLPQPRPGLEHFNRDWFHRRRFWIWGAVAGIVLLELLLVVWLLFPAAPGGLDGCLASPEGAPVMAMVTVGTQRKATYADGCFFFAELPPGRQQVVLEPVVGAPVRFEVEIVSDQALTLGTLMIP
ncbi:hypothetical protein EYB53_016515 [Candidatus Chloroploca sp. M-50]|uniref:Uncharacterized protein n=1 Tax=Candidatus Chloroploca mongolica TaxID=2528176 RepID=A0ABS4DD00_9CHLR|nr:carboxypeptidase regulatory-like domain-containing protein [Candidatus Chloroploca mongolica]MBP1467318.1 hypothetical protein [Candidatus Chloroploca mongolica]